ncbi:MAG: TldD/PmbA family protein [Eubacteriales bacterium]|nr:TldD/PmbA family protein [Eubacteriales bacterium]MDD3881620.1 TldD/PmbA family protein [Eubacteriales bacterium]MDD4512321.1 TldD/PmbA family protein [Eubacteriales bacterium]
MLNKQTAQEVLAEAMKTGGDFADIFCEDRIDHALSLKSGKLETANSLRSHGAGVRVIKGNQAYYVYGNDTSREGLLKYARRAAQAVSGSELTHIERLSDLDFTDIHPISQLPTEVPMKDKVKYLMELDKAARLPEIVQTVGGLTDSVQDVVIANTRGVFAKDRRVYTRIRATAIASNGTENQTGTISPGAMMGYELFSKRVDPAEIARQAAKSAVTMLHAPMCPAGVMPVCIDNGFGGVIFHEACGHSLEATSVAFGASVFAGKLGEMIAAPCVTAIDDGTIPNEWGSTNIDDEGTPTNKLVLIENGVLKNYMIDILGGIRMGMPSTGSGRRQSYAYAPTSRMRNTYIAPGNDDDNEMISSMGDGLYCAKMGGGSVNTATGEFNFAVDEGYLVKDGKIVNPVRGASLIGKGADIIKKIDKVGKALKHGQGMCGSRSGSVPVNVGQPMIRVSSITVGGR